MRILFTAFFFLAFFTSRSQTSSVSSSEIYEHLKQLNVLGSILYIAAHPDDENTGLLAWLRNEKQVRTAYLSMTRGDGGQNLIGDEQRVALGLIRTQELLSARKIDGASQFFTRAYDFGYSKSPEETLELWGHQKILSDVVWVIRKFRPDVIITRFPTTGEGGHGHHTASAILASEAFDAAADPNAFPEQFQYGVRPWQATRLLWNTFSFGGRNLTSPDQYSMDIGGYNVLLGKSYGEIAAKSRSQHKSQGFGVTARRGSNMEYFKTIKGARPENTLFDGIDLTWQRIGEGWIIQTVDSLLVNYSFQHPENSVDELALLYKRLENRKENFWIEKKINDLKNLLRECSGLYFEATTENQFGIQGDSVEIKWTVINRSKTPVELKSIVWGGQEYNLNVPLPFGEDFSKDVTLNLSDSLQISQPYWLRRPMDNASYTVKSQRLIGKPENDPYSVKARFVIGGELLQYDVPIRYKSRDPVKGEVNQPFFIIPPIGVETVPALALSLNQSPESIQPIIISNEPAKNILDTVWKFSSGLKKIRNNGNVYFTTARQGSVKDTISLVAKMNNREYHQYKTLIEYPHIPDILYFQDASTILVQFDLKIAGKHIGYIPGAGDKIPEALAKMGYIVTVLSEQDITKENLSVLDAIITGVRAYNVHPWLNDVYPVFMDFVHNGGVMVVQYNTSNRISSVNGNIGPYTFDISRNRVTDEHAAVKFLHAESDLLHYPNQISQKDFEGWIQERSTYHASNFEEHYTALLGMHDPGEQAQTGSLIYADYGKGRFIYTGLVFFRELPAGVPGAYRLLANLLAAPLKK